MADDRKKDTRQKIALGGLVVNAGLRQADRAFLLGVLMEAASIRVGSSEYHRLKAMGGMAFQADRLKDTQARQPLSPSRDDHEKAANE